MIKFENCEVLGWEHAIRGMRNPMNSWEKSDTKYFDEQPEYRYDVPDIGPNDQKLMMRLRNAGTDHRKFMRMIVVYVDITAPRYWWPEMDAYKVGVVRNSCSTMHKIHDKEFTLEDFSYEHLMDFDAAINAGCEIPYCEDCGNYDSPLGVLEHTIDALNRYRDKYLEAKNKFLYKGVAGAQIEMYKYWWQMIQLLPQSYNQKATLILNYEVLANIYKSRRNHKLDEWREFCKWIEELPYSELITGKEE